MMYIVRGSDTAPSKRLLCCTSETSRVVRGISPAFNFDLRRNLGWRCFFLPESWSFLARDLLHDFRGAGVSV